MNAFGWLVSMELHGWTLFLLAPLCTIATYTDLRWTRIPNHLTVAFTLLGVSHHLIFSGWTGLVSSIVGFGLGFIAVWLIYVCRGVGAGDVKLFAAIGSIVGWAPTLWILLYSILLSGLIGMLILLYRWIQRRSWPGTGKTGWMHIYRLGIGFKLRGSDGEPLRFPFMLAVLPAVLLLFGRMYL